MFYSQFILAKKGPLGTIWIAAHLERKLRKNQVADTDIGVSVDSILFPEVPIALRLSSHLLLGVVRIYSRKVNYLFDDCSEALLKIKQAFRSTAVDLPPDESTAPYHSITLPETFDLDDFELLDNENFQGNYIDHHVSTRDQITLQDTMEGVVFSTSQFGLDERFGDGDTSQIRLDFDEDQFLGKVAAHGNDGISDGDPLVLAQSKTPLEKHEIYEVIHGTSETMPTNGIGNQKEVLAANTEFVTYAQAPSTPGLFEEPNLSGVQELMTGNDHLDLEDHNFSNLAAMGGTENAHSMSGPRCGDHSTLVLNEENGSHMGNTEIKQANSQEQDQIKHISPALECSNGTVGAFDGPNRVEDIHNDIVINNEAVMLFLDQKDEHAVEPAGVRLDETVASPSCSQVTSELEDPARKICSSSSCVRVSEDYLEDQQTSLNPEGQNDIEIANNMGESCTPNIKNSFYPLSHEEMASAEVPVLRACNSLPRHHTMLSHADKISESPCNLPSAIVGPSSLDNATSFDNQFRNLDGSATSDLPAPENFLCVPEGFISKPSDFLVESTPDKEIIGGDAGIILISGKKGSSIESTMTVQSLNSVETFGEARGKRTAGSIPDDDDLLSSILVGRKSSVLKMKPTPPAPEICTKRSQTAVRGTGSKRKVLMDDSMVLHGDTIRQQLTNTEDIRRVRKKAPCTRPEISMIQRQFLEDEIFTEPIFTGMSAELIFLHTETFDLSTRISENDQDNASAEFLKDVDTSMRQNVSKKIEPVGSTEPVITKAQPAGIPIENDNQEAEDNNRGSQNTDAQEQGISDLEEFNTSKHQSLGEMAEMEIDRENFEVAHPVFGDINSVSADVNVQSRLMDKTDDEDASLQIDASCMSPDKKLDAQPMEVDASIVEASIQEGFDAIDVSEHNVEIRPDVQIGFSELTDDATAMLATVSLATEEGINLNFSNDQPVEENGSNVQHIGNETEVLDANLGCNEDRKFSCMGGEGDDIASLNDKENLGCPEADPQSGKDAEVIPNHPAGDPGDFEDVIFGNETEFLNVDDDEIAEDVDDMPCAEETRLLENSGWSSRTRAVAKYLQALFDKEAVSVERVLGMDSLLSGKTRKEASRMFFETLVLKTRDYIHVEQAKPFDNLNVRPRVKLMKSDF